jgi:hypothetical protein
MRAFAMLDQSDRVESEIAFMLARKWTGLQRSGAWPVPARRGAARDRSPPGPDPLSGIHRNQTSISGGPGVSSRRLFFGVWTAMTELCCWATEKRGECVGEVGFGQDHDLVPGPKLGVGTYRYQSAFADDDAHPDPGATVNRCTPWGSSRSRTPIAQGSGSVVRIGRCSTRASAGTELPCTRTENATTTTTMP